MRNARGDKYHPIEKYADIRVDLSFAVHTDAAMVDKLAHDVDTSETISRSALIVASIAFDALAIAAGDDTLWFSTYHATMTMAEDKQAHPKAATTPPWLSDLLSVLGWEGGTIHDALREVARLKAAEASHG